MEEQGKCGEEVEEADRPCGHKMGGKNEREVRLGRGRAA